MRKLAHVEKIADIKPIPGADRIEAVTVLGWQVVVKKGEFHIGDQVVYIEIDARVPSDHPAFAFLADRKYKVKSIRLRNTLSQGLVMPMHILPRGQYEEGQDVTDVLKIRKIEDEEILPLPQENRSQMQRGNPLREMKWFQTLMRFPAFRNLLRDYLPAEKRWPEWVTRTDEERVQNMPWILEEKQPFYVTEKIDGTSATFSLHKEGMKWRFYICSRNIVLEPPEKNQPRKIRPNAYLEIAQTYQIETLLRTMVKKLHVRDHLTLQGEIIGEGIQKNKYNLQGKDLYLFNVVADGKKYDPVQVQHWAEEQGLKSVPVLAEDYILPDSVDELQTFATGQSALYDTLREGVVIRSKDMEISFKCISNEFLLKWGL